MPRPTFRLMAMPSELLLAGSILVGIAVPPVAELLRPYLFAFVFFLMLFSLLTIRLRDVLPNRRLSARLVTVMAWQMIALPLAVGLWHRLAPGAGAWSELMFITACAGSIFGASAFARVMNLDTAFTLRGVIAGTLLMPVVLVLLAPFVTQRLGDFDFGAYVMRLFIFILAPLGAAYWYQSRRPAHSERETLLFGRLTIVFLALFGIAIMDGIGERLWHQPAETLGLLGLALAVYGLFFGLGVVLFLPWGRRQALTTGLLSAYRNLALVLAVGGNLLPPGFIVYAALWQIPMYLTPLAVRLWKGRARQSERTAC